MSGTAGARRLLPMMLVAVIAKMSAIGGRVAVWSTAATYVVAPGGDPSRPTSRTASWTTSRTP
jgi:hypothetical protein